RQGIGRGQGPAIAGARAGRAERQDALRRSARQGEEAEEMRHRPGAGCATKEGDAGLVPASLSIAVYTTSEGLPIMPPRRATTNSTRKMKKTTFAISALATAMPPKPNRAAIRDTTRKISARRNMMGTSSEG